MGRKLYFKIQDIIYSVRTPYNTTPLLIFSKFVDDVRTDDQGIFVITGAGDVLS